MLQDGIMGKKALPLRILVGFILGVALGFLAPEFAISLKPMGDIFINAVKMLIIPIVFFTVSLGIANMGDMEKLKRVGSKVVLVYVLMTVIACIVGLLVAFLVIPADIGTSLTVEKFTRETTTPTVSKFFMSMIPDNPIGAMAKGDVMQTLVFSILVGIAMVALGDKVEDAKRIFSQGADISFRILNMIMEFSPLGVFALMAYAVGFFGAKVFGALASFVLADYIACLVMWFVFMLLPVWLYTGANPIKTMKAMVEIWVVATSTTSSAATMPVTMRVTTDRFKVPEWLVAFSIPLGTTINLAGAAVWKSILIVLVAQFYGLTLSIDQMIITVLFSSLLSIAAPGIPGGGIVMGVIMLTLMGMPYDIMGLIAGIYRVIDMIHTPLNVSGDVMGTLLVAKSEGIWSGEDFNKAEE